MSPKNLSLDGKVRAISALVVVIIFSLGWVTYDSTSQLFSSYHWVYHTHEVLESLETLTNDLTDIARGAHDFMLVPDAKHLEAYKDSVRAVTETADKIAALTQDNPVQQGNIVLLKPKIDDLETIYGNFILLGKNVSEKKWDALWAKRQVARLGTVAVIGQMVKQENTLLMIRNQVEADSETRTQWAIFGVVIFVTLLAVGIGFNIVRHLHIERNSAEKLREKDAITAQFLESLPMGVFVVTADGKPFYLNTAALKLLGRGLTMSGSSQTLSQFYQTFVAGTTDPYPAEKSPMALALRGKKTAQDDIEVHRPDGEIIPLEVSGTPIFANDGTLSYASTTFWDISERKKHQLTLRNLSIHDELTGLLNRRGFFTSAEQLRVTAERLKNRLIMLFIDLDGLKQVNDKLGHQVGDDMIKTFGRIIGEHFRKIDVVARMGGDEFGVLAMDQSLDDKAIVRRLREKIEAHNASPSAPYRLDFSVGSAVYDPEKPCDLTELIFLADERMYAEKKEKKRLAGPRA